MVTDLQCPACKSDNTQRLTSCAVNKALKGRSELAKTAFALAYREPKKPWASTIGFLIALGCMPLVSALRGSESVVPPLAFLLIWLGVRYGMKQDYERKFRAWEDKLNQEFICLRCGNTFTPTSMGPRSLRTEEWSRDDEREIERYKRIVYAALFGIAAVALVVYAFYESKPNGKPTVSRPSPGDSSPVVETPIPQPATSSSASGDTVPSPAEEPQHEKKANDKLAIEAEKRFEDCRQKLKKAQQLEVLYNLEWNRAIPKVVVGPTFYSIAIDAKEGFADTVNCFLMVGESKYINFDLLDWQTGKRVARYSAGRLKMD